MFISKATTSEAHRFDPSAFFRNRKGLYVWGSFHTYVVEKAGSSAETRAIATRSVALDLDMSDAEIEGLLGDGKLFTEDQLCDTLADMITNQPNGEDGPLINNGFVNLFYLQSCVVDVRWSPNGSAWHVGTYRRGDGGWCVGRVFFPAN